MKSTTSFTTPAPHGLPAHIYTKCRWLLPGCYSRRRRFSHSSTRWQHLVKRFQIDTYVFMSSHNHITSVPIPAHTAWTCHILLQKMHQHHTMRWWTSVTSQNFQDVMTTTSDEDIPDLEDVLRLWIWTMVWINIYTRTLSTWICKAAQTTMYLAIWNMLTNTDNMFHVAIGICEL